MLFREVRLAPFDALINHNGHEGHKGSLNGLPFVSLVSFVVTRRCYTELKIAVIRNS
jgi:hypothetical protein